MTLPEHLTRDFDFDEAIDMAELCHRARQIFAPGRSSASTLYATLFADEWRFAHTIGGNSGAQVLIVRQANRNQWALVFQGREQVERPAHPTDDPSQGGDVQEIPITNLEDDEPVAAEATLREPVRSAAYPPLPGELSPPPFGARVGGQWLHAFDACKDELEGFFDSLVSSAEQTRPFRPQELEVYLTGHGAGGCLAALCALHLKRRWEARIDFPFFNLKLYSFGAPRLGNRLFVDYYNGQMKGFSYCVQNLLDGATYEPAVTAPFPYNLQLLLPSVDYVRNGAEYHMAYAQIGEVIPLVGVGQAKQLFHFKGPFQSLLVAPFSHEPEGYKQMLVEARRHRETYWKPVQGFADKVDGWRKELVATFQKPASKTASPMR